MGGGFVEDDKPELAAEAASSDGDRQVDQRPNPAQRRYLSRGLNQAGGKLPLFDDEGQRFHPALIRACMSHGWSEPWFGNPLKPDWLTCKLTDKGRRVLNESH